MLALTAPFPPPSFDPVYVTYFKTNLKRVQDYPALLAYVRACYGIPAVKRTTNIKHIKMHYYTSHCLKGYNNNGVIPAANGPALE
jgi:putative glutathione S-transferase